MDPRIALGNTLLPYDAVPAMPLDRRHRTADTRDSPPADTPRRQEAALSVTEANRRALCAGRGTTGRLELDITTRDGDHLATVEIVLRHETIEVWHQHRSRGITDRLDLRRRFTTGTDTRAATNGETTWVITPDAVALAIPPELPLLRLPPTIATDLRRWI